VFDFKVHPRHVLFHRLTNEPSPVPRDKRLLGFRERNTANSRERKRVATLEKIEKECVSDLNRVKVKCSSVFFFSFRFFCFEIDR
jgi:hypothetical protein